MIMSYQMINVYQLYIIQNHIGQSVKDQPSPCPSSP